jgi:predicted transcriptional regulator
MSQQVRIQILVQLERQSRTGSPDMKDTRLSEATGIPVEEIRREIEVLETQGLVRTEGAPQAREAIISPEGRSALESLMKAASKLQKPPTKSGDSK